jgi:hypothetical protein
MFQKHCFSSRRLAAACALLFLAGCGGSEAPSETRGLAQVSALGASTGEGSLATASGAVSAALPAMPASRTLATVATSTATTTAGAVGDRAMWTWYDADVGTTAKQTRMLDFAAARKVTHIFLHSETLLNKPALLTAFLNRAGARGIKVELLFGAAEWSLPQNHYKPIEMLQRANAYISRLTGNRPVGIHFDIEPHGLALWQQDPVTLGHHLVDLYTKLMAIKANNLYINADIAMGYEYVSLTRGGVTKTLSHWMVDTTDRTTLMDYRDYALGEDSIVSHALHPANYALSRGKRTVVGVETTCNQEYAKLTFCEQGQARMESELAKVGSYFAVHAGYGGLAIHDYANYRLLKP